MLCVNMFTNKAVSKEDYTASREIDGYEVSGEPSWRSGGISCHPEPPQAVKDLIETIHIGGNYGSERNR